RHLELQREELLSANEIGDRTTLEPVADQVAKALASHVGGRLLVAGIELDALAVEAMGQQDLGIQPGKFAALPGQVPGGPVEEPADRPCLLFRGHGAFLPGERVAAL